MEAVKLHRCPFTFLKSAGHGCWNVQHALEEAGIPHEVVKVPALPRSRRKDVIRLTGQGRVPVIEFADGTGLRAESAELVERIRGGRLFEGRAGSAEPSAPATPSPSTSTTTTTRMPPGSTATPTEEGSRRAS